MNLTDQDTPVRTKQLPAVFCFRCGSECVVPHLGVIGACPGCGVRNRFTGPLFGEPAPLITVAKGMPRWKQ